MIKKLTILVGRLVLLLLSQLLFMDPSMSVFYPLLCFLYFIRSICICFASVSCLLICFFRSLLCLQLLCFGELSACLRLPWLALSAFIMPQWVVYLFLSSMTRSICVCYPLPLCLLCFGELSALSTSFIAHSVCICYLYLFCVVCYLVYSICICCISVSYLLRLRLLWLVLSTSVVCAVCVSLLCLGESSILSTSFVGIVYVCCASVNCLFYLRLP